MYKRKERGKEEGKGREGRERGKGREGRRRRRRQHELQVKEGEMKKGNGK